MKRRRNKPASTLPAQRNFPGDKAKVPPSATPSARRRAFFSHPAWWITLGLFLGTFWVFLPARTFEFFRFDDPHYILDNPHVKAGLTFEGLAWAFRATHAGNWHPLTWLSHMLDCQLLGLSAGRFHLVNALLHAANATLLFLALRRLTGAIWRSALVAGLFALHPLHVESVAWISERKDVLSALFFMLTLLAYARYAELRSPAGSVRDQGVASTGTEQASPALRPSCILYLLALCCFALGLLSKPMLVTVPFVLLLLDFWPLQRTPRLRFLNRSPSPAGLELPRAQPWFGLLLEKMPFFLLAIAQSLITLWAQKAEGAVAASGQLPFLWRLGNALIAYCRYLQKMFWPDQLAFLYPHPGRWPIGMVVAAAGLLTVISLGALWLGRRRRYWLVGWLWFLGMLVPTIGLVQVGQQSWADRYSYLPLIGPFIILAWSLGDLARTWGWLKAPVAAAAAALVSACAVLTSNQLALWKSTEPLYCRALDVALQNKIYRRAYETIPLYVDLHLSLARDWIDVAQTPAEKEQLVAYLRKLALLRPNSPPLQLLLGEALARQGKWKEAVSELIKGNRSAPRATLPTNISPAGAKSRHKP
ncbi:MAG TPA: hypothetical protein P5205_02330 [Candidatus Paceibacterota bacterium]|nr:hypothetical protein [Verrucomicrobiota bacterium]HSA09183.1 hypothetical protein [Candidatus Paceibacterota bacterium]